MLGARSNLVGQVEIGSVGVDFDAESMLLSLKNRLCCIISFVSVLQSIVAESTDHLLCMIWSCLAPSPLILVELVPASINKND